MLVLEMEKREGDVERRCPELGGGLHRWRWPEAPEWGAWVPAKWRRRRRERRRIEKERKMEQKKKRKGKENERVTEGCDGWERELLKRVGGWLSRWKRKR